MKDLSDKQKVDPSVECLTRLFPEDFIRNAAAETGFIQRERKIDPVILFWVITIGFGVNFLRTIRGVNDPSLKSGASYGCLVFLNPFSL